MKFSKDQLKAYSDSLFELANIAMGALVFGSYFSDRLSLWLIPFGLIIYFSLVSLAFRLRKEK
jgi:hypothetical protein